MITTLHGDCRDILPTLAPGSVQCIVTSPPYYGLRDYGLPPSDWPEVSYTPLAGVPSVTIPAQSCCLGLEDSPLAFVAHLVAGRGERNDGFAQRWQPSPDGLRNRRSIWRISSQGTIEGHYATFPERIPELCILAGSRPGDTVLDPFAGSGTTMRVAERLQRNSIGIDLNADYIELQHKRTDGVQVEMVGL